MYFLYKFLAFYCISVVASSESKYSANMNSPSLNEPVFRMEKINLIWHKARTRLAEGKLKSLYKELKEQDKEEILLKKLQFEGQEKGTKLLDVKRKWALILNKYNLNDIEQERENLTGEYSSSPQHEKQLFKDKRLDKLWSKVEKKHFTDEELLLLKQEFREYENKVNDYHYHIDQANEKVHRQKLDEANKENSIDDNASTDASIEHLHLLNKKHHEVKRSFNELEDRVLNMHKNYENDRESLYGKVEFEEARVQKLWKQALKTGFTESELLRFKEELKHFETRVSKLSFLQENYPLENDSKKSHQDKHLDIESVKHLRGRLSDLTKQVDKLERDLENKIMARHIEL